ncbi:MAG: hypothetical protein ACLFVE_15970 [Chitinispirillaceae bacterium]
MKTALDNGSPISKVARQWNIGKRVVVYAMTQLEKMVSFARELYR